MILGNSMYRFSDIAYIEETGKADIAFTTPHMSSQAEMALRKLEYMRVSPAC